MSTASRKLIAAVCLIGAAVCFAAPWMQGLGNRTVRFLRGQHLCGGALPGRSHEKLPSVAVESGNKLCCRMLYCDFRFPLPTGTRVGSMEPVTGGFDTVRGGIIVTNTNGQAVDLTAYAKAMRKDGFRVNDYGLGFAANSPDGGFVAAEGSDRCRITFSFFGDY